MSDVEPSKAARAFRKFMLHPMSRMMVGILIFVAFGFVFSGVNYLLHVSASSQRFVGELENAFACLAALAIVGKYIEKKPAGEWGFPRTHWAARLFGGFAIGAALISAVIGLLASVGDYRALGLAPLPPGEHPAPQVLGAVALFLAVAVFEEVLFRGIIFRALEGWLGSLPAILISGLSFGLIHLFNPHTTWISALAIAIEAGVLLACAYTFSRGLWLPIGLHWAWNLFEGPIFGTSVSGTSGYRLIQAQITGSVWLTGGEFGPEAGVFAVVLGLGLGVAFFMGSVRRGNLKTRRRLDPPLLNA